MKIATWNLNSIAVRLPQLLDWLQANPVDAIALQETKVPDERFPIAPIEAAGYRAVWHGQRSYNGVALLARTPMDAVQRNLPGFDDEQARVIAATVAGLRVVGVYVPNGQAPDSDKYAYKLRWFDALHAWLRAELAVHPALVLLGDFNVAPDDRDVYDPAAFEGQILCTPAERAQFARLLELGLADAFRLFEQPPKSWSWWDYRNLAFRRNQGLRIDHILVSRALQPAVRACTIDKTPRRNQRPSDHTPVIVELQA